MSPTLNAALTQQVGPVTTDWPLWAVRKEDNTRTAVTLGEGLWRWRIQDIAQHNGESAAFDALVNGTLQYLSSRTDVNRLRIQAPERLDEDVRCTFVAEVYDASLTPTKDVDVLLSLTQRGGLTTEHNFAAKRTRHRLDRGPRQPPSRRVRLGGTVHARRRTLERNRHPRGSRGSG